MKIFAVFGETEEWDDSPWLVCSFCSKERAKEHVEALTRAGNEVAKEEIARVVAQGKPDWHAASSIEGSPLDPEFRVRSWGDGFRYFYQEVELLDVSSL